MKCHCFPFIYMQDVERFAKFGIWSHWDNCLSLSPVIRHSTAFGSPCVQFVFHSLPSNSFSALHNMFLGNIIL